MNHFLADVLHGLSAPQKFLMSKYFYDKKGDEIFQEIMAMPEYYLTNCEWEILSEQREDIAKRILEIHPLWDVVEFGPGNAVKSGELLESLQLKNGLATYFPIDISENIIHELNTLLPQKIPGIKIKGFAGEYFEMLPQIGMASKNPKLVLFLGANIGNFSKEIMHQFLEKLHSFLDPADMVFIGFDLKKHPDTILQAYCDKEGITERFNLNLLERMNRELNADFVPENFEHYCCYDPVSGACTSHLISLNDQRVEISDYPVHFARNETIFMEISQKYNEREIDFAADDSGFKPVAKFFDSKRWFVDVLWKVGK